MPLEPPLTATAQDRLNQVRQQIDLALEALVADMVALATAERDTAISEAQAQAAAALEKARTESEAALARRLAAEAEERVAKALAAEHAEAEKRLAEAAADTRAQERQCDLACLERLLDGLRDLDGAVTLSQVLDKLAEHAGSHVARVAVLIVRPSTGSLRLSSGTPSNVEGSGRGELVEPRDRELRGWRMRGFGQADADPSTTTVSLGAPTVVREAVDTRTRATTDSATPAGGREPLPFAALPGERVGLALPLTVGVRTVAVLYADEGANGEVTVPSAWPETLEILARHAAARLELLTMARAYGLHAQPFDSQASPLAQGGSFDSGTGTAQGSAQEKTASASQDAGAPPAAAAANRGAPGGRPSPPATDAPVDAASRQALDQDGSALRYARLLISEIKLYHEEAVNAGRRDANLLARLGPEIARARRLYEERVPADVRSRADHFDQELVRTLANGDPKLLGQAT